MSKTVYRSQFAEYRAGSKANGQPQFIFLPSGVSQPNPAFRDEPVVVFSDHIFSTSDPALIEQIERLPGFSREPGVGDFWRDGYATDAQNEPKTQPADPPADPAATTEQEPPAEQSKADGQSEPEPEDKGKGKPGAGKGKK